jgi:POT family proton-dependent oligopeptide transporter
VSSSVPSSPICGAINLTSEVNSFWCYLTPIFGAWIADEFWGRLKTIQTSTAFAMVGHIILIIAALPSVIARPSAALACFIVGLIIFGMGVGGFKYNFS